MFLTYLDFILECEPTVQQSVYILLSDWEGHQGARQSFYSHRVGAV